MIAYKGINLKKIDKMARLSFENALRLHFDSILLFKNKSFPSSFFLSSLALEEIGKSFILMDFFWHSCVEGRMEEKHERDYISLIYSHHSKQNSFGYNFGTFYKPADFFKKLYDGEHEILKQNSIYVGLKKNKKNIDMKSKIISPMEISEQKAKNQITEVQNSFVEITHGELSETGGVDSEEVAKLLNKKLFKKLEKAWPFLSSKLKKRVKKYAIT